MGLGLAGGRPSKNANRMTRYFERAKEGRLVWVSISLTVALSALLIPINRARAQTCGNALSASPVIFPISGSAVVTGQVVSITRVFFGSSDPGNCLFRNGEGFFLYPDGTIIRAVTNLNLN